MYTALLHTRCLSYYVMHAVQGDRASAACLQLHTGCSEGLRLTRGVGKTVLLVMSMRSKNLLSLAFYHFCTRHVGRGLDTGRQQRPRLAAISRLHTTCWQKGRCKLEAQQASTSAIDNHYSIFDCSHNDYVHRYCHCQLCFIPKRPF